MPHSLLCPIGQPLGQAHTASTLLDSRPEGGRHWQRAFRDALADLLPLVHDWLPTIRISDTEVTVITAAPGPVLSLRTLLGDRGVPVACARL